MTPSGDPSSELTEARRRLVELEAAEAERAHAAKVQEALYRIAELASAARDLQEFYRAIHGVIGELMYARNLYIALYDEERQLISWPYAVDEVDTDFPDPSRWDQFGSGDARGTTAYLLRTGKPQHLSRGRLEELLELGEIDLIGDLCEDWLGVPLKSDDGRTVGVLVVQSYLPDIRYTEQDEELLAFVGQTVGVALSRARAIEETRQRNAQLALINSVQEALAGELELQAIYDAVGDRIRDVFDAQVVDIGIYDETSRLVHFAYTIERGVRFSDEPIELFGFRKHVMETREPLMIAENSPDINERYGNPYGPLSGEPSKSMLYVPLVVGARATGVISLQNLDREHAFSDSDQQLLETLAGGLSVALENARLVHETRQRNAELAVINSVQESIAGELDQQAIYDLVGEKLREIFDAQAVDIGVHDETAGILRFVYQLERGVHFPNVTAPVVGFRKHVMETQQPLAVLENMDAALVEYGNPETILGEPSHGSAIFQPLVVGGRATGAISIQNLDHEHAFDESDQRLLATIAGSLGVALDNARLVDETRQRNAELALINSVQAAIAGELDPQAIYDLVGDKLQEVFDAQVVSISVYDESSGLLSFPYVIERGQRLDEQPIPLIGFRKHVMETREPLMLEESTPELAERYGNPYVLSGEASKSALFVPLVLGGRSTGVISLQNVDRTHAFDEDDQRLLATLAGSLSVALENARLVHETRQRNAELALINSVQAAIAGELDPQAIYDLVGDKLQEVFDAQVVTINVFDESSGLLAFPYVIERGERLEAQPIPVIGFRKHVMETLEPLLLDDITSEVDERYGNPGVLGGEPTKSALFVPLVVGGRATGVVSIQNVDRAHAFGEDDQRLLTTLAGSVSVALDNARLIHETRQRVAELATVNSVGQALSSQLDLDALIELVGEQVRESFDADIAYVALHDRPSGRIDFAYYHESGERREQESMTYGEGLTTRILTSREPLLLNRSPQFEEHKMVGTSVRSYLGVPILVGDSAIGVLSVQSIDEEGRFGEADSRLLATIAANVGVVIQNARLFTEVERQRGYLESLASISPTAVVVLDTEERVTDWNPAAAELFGYSAEEALGRPVDDLVFGDSGREEGREITQEAMRAGRAQRIAQRRRRDGSLVDVELMLVPLTVDGSHTGFLGVYHDVTELQRARQEAEAATQAKSAFLATMSHEIRTPMNAVIGMTDLLLGTELTGEQREFAEVVRTSGDALLHVIDDILDYSKIEAGKLDLEREPFRLRECVEGALDIVAPRSWEKGIELGCLIDEAVPAGILGDEARLRQVLLNLLSNGVKFTETGEVVVLVRAEPTGSDSHRLELIVRDTGIGIPRDRMDRLFTSFSQVDASTTRRFGGTGLGLAISKRLVELMGGTISAQSEQGSGSTFSIALPVTAAEVPSQIHLEQGLPQLAGKRILVVDDNATNREIVTRHARSWGMEPVAVETPAEALSLIEAGEPFEVAVLDMMMPDMDGLELGAEIRRRRGEQDLPLVLLTSLGRLPEEQWNGVFAAQLAKPLKASQLYNTLLHVLTAGEAREEAAALATDGKQARSSLRILLAEDNPMNQKVALRLLERLGYSADVVWNGLEALEAIEGQSYDVVLMDVQMPELDGLDTTRRICDRWPPESRPHIIAMTANALPEDREACFAAGMSDYIAKPIRSDALAAALKRAQPLRSDHDGPRPSGDAGPGEDGISLEAAALQNLRDLGGVEFLTEVVDVFLADAPALIASLRSSLERHDTEELRRAAHTLKSNGSTLGAVEFAKVCHNVEQHARDGLLDGVPPLVDQIEQEYPSLKEALSSLRAEPVS